MAVPNERYPLHHRIRRRERRPSIQILGKAIVSRSYLCLRARAGLTGSGQHGHPPRTRTDHGRPAPRRHSRLQQRCRCIRGRDPSPGIHDHDRRSRVATHGGLCRRARGASRCVTDRPDVPPLTPDPTEQAPTHTERQNAYLTPSWRPTSSMRVHASTDRCASRRSASSGRARLRTIVGGRVRV